VGAGGFCSEYKGISSLMELTPYIYREVFAIWFCNLVPLFWGAGLGTRRSVCKAVLQLR
jgi:hypothetical protein